MLHHYQTDDVVIVFSIVSYNFGSSVSLQQPRILTSDHWFSKQQQNIKEDMLLYGCHEGESKILHICSDIARDQKKTVLEK